MVWVLKIIEMNKIMLGCVVISGQVLDKVMMDIHTKIKHLVDIVLQVVKILNSKQQQ